MPILRQIVANGTGLLCLGAVILLSIEAPGRADSRTPYELRPELDVPVIAVSGVIAAGFILRDELPAAHCAPRCLRAQVPAFERWLAGRYDPDARLVSDLGVALTLSAGALTAALDGGLVHFIIAAQAVLVSSAITVTTTMAVRRPRPFVYGDRAPLEDRTAGGTSLSFPSGHTANAFAATLAVFHGMHLRAPHSPLPWVVLGVGLALSTGVGAGRVLAGDHFPSDVLAGAVIGSSIGWLIPELHRADVGVSVVLDARSRAIVVRGAL